MKIHCKKTDLENNILYDCTAVFWARLLIHSVFLLQHRSNHLYFLEH